MPMATMETNQTRMMGENKKETLAVPKRCTRTSRKRIAAEMPATPAAESVGAATVMPPIADRTEMAGVRMPSLMTADTPTMAMTTRMRL